jgi:hypothetical protein
MYASGAAQAALECGYTGLLVKALDGTRWMSYYDPDPSAIGGPEDVAALTEYCHSLNLDLYVWTNPLAQSLVEQALLTTEAINACDGGFLDVEPYNQFWGIQPPGTATAFMELVRGYAPHAWIGIQPDPRGVALAGIKIDEWLPYVDGMSGQHYWSDFNTFPTVELHYAQSLAEKYATPYYPTLPGNAQTWPDGSLIEEFDGHVTWRYGTTPHDRLEWIGSLQLPA